MKIYIISSSLHNDFISRVGGNLAKSSLQLSVYDNSILISAGMRKLFLSPDISINPPSPTSQTDDIG